MLAYPVETLDARNNPWRRLAELVTEYDPVEVVLGWPRNLAGQEGPAVEAMRDLLRAASSLAALRQQALDGHAEAD